MNQTINRTKGTVRFAPKESLKNLEKSPNQESLIYLHYSFGTKNRFKYSTGYYCTFSNWDKNKQRIRNKASIKNRDLINNFLTDLSSAITTGVSELDSKQITVSKKLLKKILDDFTNKNQSQKEETKTTLFTYIETFLELKSKKIKIGTLRSYKQTKKRLIEFNKGKYKIDFDNIDLSFYYDFVEFLEEEDYALNSIGKHIKNLKSFLNKSVEDGINNNLAFMSKDFKPPKELTTQIYLTEKELKGILKLDLSKNKSLELARDIFVIGCEIGQRVSDYNGISKNSIITKKGIKLFKLIQKKTNKEVYCRVTPIIKEIMSKRYDNCPPPLLSDVIINLHLKTIGEKAKINELVEVTKTKGGIKQSLMVEKYKLIATHTARRTFCTIKYKKGMPIYDIMHFSGHTTEKEFYKYIRIDKQEKTLNIIERNLDKF